MTEPVSPSVGWGVVHLFCQPGPLLDGEAVRAAVKETVETGHQVVPVAILGHKADLAFMALGPDLRQLRRFQTRAAGGRADGGRLLRLADRGVRVRQGHARADDRGPAAPPAAPEGKPAFCFYPMSKRREVQQNWFTLPYDDRNALMREHGASGRTFAGRVLQVVTGSTGLDDHEWGVTLFAVRPDDLKEVVYTMRYDRASAIYAEFGPFYAGMVTSLDDLLAGT